MNYAAFIGLDRGDRLIDWVELDDTGATSARGQLQNRPERLAEWTLALLARFPDQKLALAIEQPAAALLHFFRAFAQIDVFALNPGSVAAYRLSFKPSRAKSDALDAVRTFYREHGCVRHSALDKRLALIAESIPRSGQIRCARLLAAFGTDRERFPTAQSILCFSGIAPVLHSTGNRPNPLTLRRRACPVFIKQSFHEWAAQTIATSLWAKAFYEQQRAKGKKHHTAVRALAFKWIRIIHRMWIDRTRYNEQAYLQVLRQKGSSLIPDIDKILQEKKAQCA